MQKEILWIGLVFVLATSLQVKAQYAKQDTTNKKWFVVYFPPSLGQDKYKSKFENNDDAIVLTTGNNS